MKKIIAILVIMAFSVVAIGQAPNKMNYQAMIKNGNSVVSNKNVSVLVEILDGSMVGNVEFSETHSLTTSDNGIIGIEIGSISNFSVDWSSNTKYLKISIDTTGGSNHQEYSNSQILSVPYALNAKTAESTYKLGIDTITVFSTSFDSVTTNNNDYQFEITISQPMIEKTLSINAVVSVYKNGSFAYTETPTFFYYNAINVKMSQSDVPFTVGDVFEFRCKIVTTDGVKLFYHTKTF